MGVVTYLEDFRPLPRTAEGYRRAADRHLRLAQAVDQDTADALRMQAGFFEIMADGLDAEAEERARR